MAPIRPLTVLLTRASTAQKTARIVNRCSSTSDGPQAATQPVAKPVEQTAVDPQQPKKTQEQLDEEVRQKLAQLAGDGGEAGIEYEDGKPVAMRRSVQQNMFRYI